MGKENSEQLQPVPSRAQTSDAMKAEIEREYQELGAAMIETAKNIEKTQKPSGLFGKLFHTSTS